MNVPVKVAPACKWIVSPHLALFRAAWRLPPLFTVIVMPGAGVFAMAVEIRTTGNAAGPSELEAYKVCEAALRLKNRSKRTDIGSFELCVAVRTESTANSTGTTMIHNLETKLEELVLICEHCRTGKLLGIDTG